MPTQHITFPADDLTLEGVLSLPDQTSGVPGIVICHPHPLHGGDMDNNVVMALAAAFAGAGYAVLRFNFRGVGWSDGRYGEGIGEQADAKGALAYMAAQSAINAERLLLAGYSFGARVALTVAPADPRVQGIIVVAPPMRQADWPGLDTYRAPKLFFCGDADPVCPREAITALVDRLPEPKWLSILPGTDHFFLGHERTLGQQAVRLLQEFP
ncbi:MAG: alpha/beta fold hydrolase [Nitrospinae bacterium]|nr:alpha/beta fold hydrolase [Nitrospinota bacterium]